MFKIVLIVFLIIFLFFPMKSFAMKRTRGRKAKFLSMFNIVRFENSPCSGYNKRNGTCYTLEQCQSKNGINSGSCANGYGVCCVSTKSCGEISGENETYFLKPSIISSSCSLKICSNKDENICQLRLDFNLFVINGPSTLTNTIGNAIGDQLGASGRQVTNNGQCLTDTFTVSNPSGSRPPVICGLNTGEHMYVDASESCNELTFQLGSTGIGTDLEERDWEIKITKLSCQSGLLPPDGCTQYFYGSDSGTVQTFNYEGGNHLSNQDHVFCVRRENNFCRICWTTANDKDFMVSQGAPPGVGNNMANMCCQYGNIGQDANGYDCVEIPGAQKNNGLGDLPSRICGRSNGLVTFIGQPASTICSTSTPFYIRFKSDTYENRIEDQTTPDKGFKLVYTMDNKNC